MLKTKIKNSQGQPIILNDREERLVNILGRQANDLGYKIDITSLTAISKKIVEQKFFEIMPADYIPLKVGDGAWNAQLTTWRSFSIADDFSTGIINTGAENSRLASADAGVDSVSIKINNWAKTIGYTLFDLEMASKSGNWDMIAMKQKARKKNWDLGIQKIAFLGLSGNSSIQGLLTQSGIQPNLTVITKAIKSMSSSELKTFSNVVLDAYRTQNNRTAWPTHFVIPESDYLGLAGPSSDPYPIKSVLQQLLETFQVMTNNKNFQIKPLVYGDAAYSGLGVQRYALYNADEESIRMDIPVDYTATLANSIDNFSFQNVGYGQFTGVLAYRPLELMYFQY